VFLIPATALGACARLLATQFERISVCRLVYPESTRLFLGLFQRLSGEEQIVVTATIDTRAMQHGDFFCCLGIVLLRRPYADRRRAQHGRRGQRRLGGGSRRGLRDKEGTWAIALSVLVRKPGVDLHLLEGLLS
jgi:hypothetical protein